MEQWYYLPESGDRIPIREAHLPQLIRVGAVKPDTLVWHDRMTAWTECAKLKPELFASITVQPKAPTVKQVAPPVIRTALNESALEDSREAKAVLRIATPLVEENLWIAWIALAILAGGIGFAVFFYPFGIPAALCGLVAACGLFRTVAALGRARFSSDLSAAAGAMESLGGALRWLGLAFVAGLLGLLVMAAVFRFTPWKPGWRWTVPGTRITVPWGGG